MELQRPREALGTGRQRVGCRAVCVLLRTPPFRYHRQLVPSPAGYERLISSLESVFTRRRKVCGEGEYLYPRRPPWSSAACFPSLLPAVSPLQRTSNYSLSLPRRKNHRQNVRKDRHRRCGARRHRLRPGPVQLLGMRKLPYLETRITLTISSSPSASLSTRSPARASSAAPRPARSSRPVSPSAARPPTPRPTPPGSASTAG